MVAVAGADPTEFDSDDAIVAAASGAAAHRLRPCHHLPALASAHCRRTRTHAPPRPLTPPPPLPPAEVNLSILSLADRLSDTPLETMVAQSSGIPHPATLAGILAADGAPTLQARPQAEATRGSLARHRLEHAL